MNQPTSTIILAIVCPILVLAFFLGFRKWTKGIKGAFMLVTIICFILCALASFILITNQEDPIQPGKFWLCIGIYLFSFLWTLGWGASTKSNKQQGL